MKRLLIAAFLVITATTVLSLACKNDEAGNCVPEKICCSREKGTNPAIEEYIFWEPMSRILMIR